MPQTFDPTMSEVQYKHSTELWLASGMSRRQPSTILSQDLEQLRLALVATLLGYGLLILLLTVTV